MSIFGSSFRICCFVVFLATRARALKSRVAELVDLAAYRAGLQRVVRRGGIAPRKPRRKRMFP